MDRNDATSFWGQVVESAKESELGLLNQNTPHRASQASAGPLDRRPPARRGMGLSGRGGKTPAIELQKKIQNPGVSTKRPSTDHTMCQQTKYDLFLGSDF